ncbi:hypothetical protein P5V15_009300 [Pogonomyrmex californicus]
MRALHIASEATGFCLRLGAVVFGAGSLVFTGLQIGAEIASGLFRAIISRALGCFWSRPRSLHIPERPEESTRSSRPHS